MSLKVWLPLNGSLENIGISDYTFSIISSNTTVSNDGKIGQCYTNNSFSAGGLVSNKTITLPTTHSMFCWFKFTTLNSGSNLGGGLVTVHNHSTNSGTGITIKYVSSTTGYLSLNTGNGSSRTFNTYTGTTLLQANTWYHGGFTYDGTNIRIYLNGNLEKTQAFTGMSMTAELIKVFIWSTTYNSYNFNGSLNDVRIYDHCLSAKEVKEIAQGLILHYKLNNGLNVGGGDNILLNTSFKKQYNQTTGWDTNKNGTKLATSWGGYNSGVANQATVYHAHLKEFNGEWVYEYIKTANESWLGISQYGLQTKITAGKTYTFSWEEYHVEGTNRVGTGLYYYKTGATSPNFHLGIQQASSITRILNLWQKFSYTFTAPSDADYSKNMAWYIYGTYNGNGTFYLRHPKLEEGEIATSWTPTKDEMGIDPTKVTDSSGFGNDGVITGEITANSGSGRYNVSTYIPLGSTDYITTNNTIGNPQDAITMSIWFKSNCTTPGNSYHEIFNHATSSQYFEFAIHSSGYFRGGMVINGTRYVANTSALGLLDGNWHMISMTYDGSTIIRYIDGISQSTTAISGTLTGANGKFLLGHYGPNTSYYAKEAYIADARIYATALSANDILDLYHTSANIDNLGRVHGFEISEIAENKFFKVNLAINGDLDRASNGVGTYSQTNCTQTYENNSVRIYRPPNLVHNSSTMHNMWGGVRIRNSSINSCHEYNSDTDNLFNLQKGHTYVIYFKVKGQSSNAATSIGWTNQMGWSGGGLNPAPSNVEYLYTPVNFNGEMDCFYKFTINDEIVKTCTSSYSYAVSGKQYLSYNDFMYGFGYENTGTLGTDVYVSNYRMYDITNIVHGGNISLSGIINFLSFNEDDYNHAKISKYGEMQSIGFIEK